LGDCLLETILEGSHWNTYSDSCSFSAGENVDNRVLSFSEASLSTSAYICLFSRIESVSVYPRGKEYLIRLLVAMTIPLVA
jgi:hypothetical protein